MEPKALGRARSATRDDLPRARVVKMKGGEARGSLPAVFDEATRARMATVADELPSHLANLIFLAA